MTSEGDDPILNSLLGFLASDIAKYPERLQPMDPGLVQRLQTLVAEIEVDLDAIFIWNETDSKLSCAPQQ